MFLLWLELIEWVYYTSLLMFNVHICLHEFGGLKSGLSISVAQTCFAFRFAFSSLTLMSDVTFIYRQLCVTVVFGVCVRADFFYKY